MRLPRSAFRASYPEWIARHRLSIVAGAASLAAVGAAVALTLPVRTEFSQLLPDRESCLASADDHRLDSFRVTIAIHRATPFVRLHDNHGTQEPKRAHRGNQPN